MLADDQFLVLLRDVTLDFALEDQIGQNALGFVLVDVFDLHHPQGDQEGVQGNLMSLDQQADFLEQVPAEKNQQLSQLKMTKTHSR